MSDSPAVLLVDDDEDFLTVTAARLRREGFRPEIVTSGEKALAHLEESLPDVLVTDQRMPAMDGIALLAECRARWPQLPVLVLTGHADVPKAVAAVKHGAVDFLLKTEPVEALLEKIRAAVRPAQVGAILGNGSSMRAALELLDRACASDVNVLFTGETGSGKNLFAEVLHERSDRAGSLVVLSANSVMPERAVIELFGHARGAFTGAVQSHLGALARADGGTLLIDDIDALTLPAQAALMSFMESGCFRRVGSVKQERADVRVIATTRHDLEERVADGSFRPDLFFRFRVLPIALPPLRVLLKEEPDILASLLRRGFEAASAQTPLPELEGDALSLLRRHPFPGNVRELFGLAQRLVHEDARIITSRALELLLASSGRPESLKEVEQRTILATLEACGGNKAKAARELGISRQTLYAKLAAFRIAEREAE